MDRGPIAAVREGDSITIDIEKRRIELNLAPEVIAERLAAYTPPPPRYRTGVFAKYIASVSSAARGAVTC